MEKNMQGLQKPISEFDVGQTNFETKRKACEAQVVSTTRGGTM